MNQKTSTAPHCWAISCLIVLALTTPGLWAQRTRVSAVQIDYTAPILTITINQPVDLRTVLTMICQRIEIDCEIPSNAAGVLLSASVATGPWATVVAKLFDAANLDYAWMLPDSKQSGTLIVLSQAGTAGNVSVPSQPNVRRRISPGVVNPVSVASTSQGAVPPIAGMPRRNASPSVSDNSEGSLGGPISTPFVPPRIRTEPRDPNVGQRPSLALDSAQNAAVWNMIADQIGNSAGQLAASRQQTFLVPNPNGSPIIASSANGGPTALPFPDQLGRPIAVSPATPNGQPLNPFGTVGSGQPIRH
jgi:hypothetical protein